MYILLLQMQKIGNEVMLMSYGYKRMQKMSLQLHEVTDIHSRRPQREKMTACV